MMPKFCLLQIYIYIYTYINTNTAFDVKALYACAIVVLPSFQVTWLQ